MSDIIVKQQPESNLTIQSSEDQVVIRQAADNVVVVQTTGSSYTLPAATANSLGGIIVGSNLSISNGVLSATSSSGGVESFNNRTGNVSLTANDVTAVANGIYQANGSYLNDLQTNITTSYSSSEVVTGLRKATGSANFVSGSLALPGYGAVGVVAGNETSGLEFRVGGIFATLKIRHYAHTLTVRNSGFEVETGTANWTWSDNSILTQSRGDSRYQNAANNTWANLTGKPTFATVATSGNYTDLANTPNLSLYLTTANAAIIYLPSANFTYANIGGTIPTATNTTLGAIKVGQTLEIANGVLDVTDLTLFGGTATASGPDVYFGGGA